MRKIISIVGMLIAHVIMPTAQAQVKQVQPVLLKEQRKITKDLEQRYLANHQRALQLARKHGWVITEKTKEGATLSLQGVDDRGMPVYHVSYNNTRAAATTSTDKVWAGGSANLSLSGNNPALAGKLGIWDAGRVRASHQEFGGRVVPRDGAVTNDNHATHVAGTLIAAGLSAPARGMAYGAPNLQAWDFNFDIPEIAAAAENLLVSNHSYGSTAGWRYNGNRTPYWEWWGDISLSTTEDNKFGQYNFQAHDFDKIAYYAPHYLMVKAVGNNRAETGPAEGAPFWRINAARTAWELAEARPAGMSSNNGFESIPTYGNAKNLLIVGSVEPVEGGYTDPAQVRIAGNSSWGPTDDGRIKPDLVGNGINVYSPIASHDEAYAGYSGTSMASPNVAGSLFLLQEHYANLHNGAFMRAATLKGLAIHTADEAGAAPGPDYVHGWGLLNTEKAAAVISNTGSRHGLFERALGQNEVYAFRVTAASSGPLVVTISWTDPEGAISSSSQLNDRSPRLVNDLDVRVARGLDTFLPWVLDPANPTFPATFGDNIRDNVEQVYIANPVPGETYTITVRHKGTLQRGPQAYSLLVSGIHSQAYCVSRAQAEADSRIAHSQLGNISHTPTGCAAYRDLTGLLQQVYPGQQVPFRFALGTCGADFSKAARIFADWNSDGDFDDAGEVLATSGVIAGTADFAGSFWVPATVKTGDLLRLRIVLAETDRPEQVQACGPYQKGETQDFLLQVTVPVADVGVTGLVFPAENACALPAQTVTVRVRNSGSAPQTGISVRTEIEDQAGQVWVLQGVYNQPLAPLREASLTLTGTFAAVAGQTYSFRTHATLPGDQNPANDTHTTTRTIAGAFPAPAAKALLCGDGPVALSASGAGAMFWYDAPEGGNLLATGAQASTLVRPASKTYYVAANDFAGSLGPKTKEAFTGGGYNQYTTDLHFSTQVPLVLEKARLYVGHSGRIIFSLHTAKGALVSTTQLDVEATRTPAASGSQPNDATDAGAVYDLNLSFPQAGDYVLKIAYQNGATIFRNNAGVTGYPFGIPHVISLTGNSTSPLFYYYLYDLQVKADGCPSTRVPVVAEQTLSPLARISPGGPVAVCEKEGVLLQANPGEGYAYQWRKDGVDLEGASNRTYEATSPGAYSVRVTDTRNPAACASSLSENVVVTTLPTTASAISTSGPSVFCEGGSVTLTASEGSGYLWSTGETTRSITARASGEYVVSVQNGSGCAAVSDPVVVTVFPSVVPTVSADGPTAFCQGGSVTLTASGGGSQYRWSTGQTGPSITVAATGTYSVTVLNEQGCSVTSAPVAVSAQPALMDNTIPAGGAVCREAVPTALQGSQPTGGSGEYFFLWESSTAGPDLGFSPAPGFNKGRDYAPEPLQQSTWFRRRCVSGSCESVSAAALLSVKMPPAASVSESSSTTFCQGGSTVLTAQGGSKYLWSTGATGAAITVTESGTYTATVLNEDDCSTVTSAVTVAVQPLPPAPVISRTGNLLASSFAAGNQWYLNGQAVAGATGPALEVFRPGAYTVVATQNGCVSAPSAPLLYQALLDESTLKLSVGPNPNEGRFKLFFEVHGLEDAQLHLINTMGKTVFQQQLPQLSGRQEVAVEAASLAGGIYLVQLRFRDKVFVRKVMIRP